MIFILMRLRVSTRSLFFYSHTSTGYNKKVWLNIVIINITMWNKPYLWARSKPEKIYVEKEGSFHEYSEDAPNKRLLDRLYDVLYGQHSKDNFIELFYCLPEVFSAVHEIASRVADCSWVLKKNEDDSVIYDDAHWNKLFSNPNPLSIMRMEVYRAVAYEILTGKAMWYFNHPEYLQDNYKGILSWSVLPSQKMQADMKQDIDPYTITDVNDLILNWKKDGKVFKETRNILAALNLDMECPNDLNKVKPLILGAEKAIRNLIPVYEARGVIYVKRGMMGFVVSRKKDADGSVALTPGEKEKVRADINSTYGLTGGRDLIGITDQDLDYVATGMSIRDMMPFDETEADAIAIYKVLNIPRHLCPTKGQSTFSNADADLKMFYTDVIIPWAKRYAQLWQRKMKMDVFKRYIDVDYSHIEVFQENLKTKAETTEIASRVAAFMYKEGMITKNERNTMSGAEAVPDGDVFATESQDPVAVKLGVGGIQALKEILVDPVLDRESKKQALIILFGLDDIEAELMVPKNDKSNNQGTADQGA